MRGDFSRDTYDRIRHFSRVLQQQGRVQIDADWNEQAEILLHYVRTLAADLIGPFAGPSGDGLGFEIAGTGKAGGLKIGRGRYYVDGILCENERIVHYAAQDDYPAPPPLVASDTYVVYLDVWERHLTALEDDRIRDVALGGPDTATRTKVVWQVKVDDGKAVPFPSAPTVEGLRKDWNVWIARWQPVHGGCLRARVVRPDDDDPCLSAPEAKYRGAENQLYRVEIHHGGPAGQATFKWSRDNGSVASRVTLSGVEVVAETPRGFAAGQWVELTNDGQELRGRPGRLVKVIKVEDDRLTLEAAQSAPADVPDGEAWPTKVRRWDHRKVGSVALKEGAVPLSESAAESGWIDLEDGIQVQFLPASADGTAAHVYRTGDYWMFPARVATGDIEWPAEADGVTKAPRPPRGIRHHYAPLAIIKPGASGWIVKDCRCEFPPIPTKCGITAGYGEDGMGGTPKCSDVTP
jgi:hypothetical protein